MAILLVIPVAIAFYLIGKWLNESVKRDEEKEQKRKTEGPQTVPIRENKPMEAPIKKYWWIIIIILIIAFVLFSGSNDEEQFCTCYEVVGAEDNFICYTPSGEVDTKGECVGRKIYENK